MIEKKEVEMTFNVKELKKEVNFAREVVNDLYGDLIKLHVRKNRLSESHGKYYHEELEDIKCLLSNINEAAQDIIEGLKKVESQSSLTLAAIKVELAEASE